MFKLTSRAILVGEIEIVSSMKFVNKYVILEDKAHQGK
jgi:hypothetical protein